MLIAPSRRVFVAADPVDFHFSFDRLAGVVRNALRRMATGSRIRLFIPVHFNNHAESPGLKRGGVLNIVRHEIEFVCPSENIPQFIEIDLAGMDIGDSLHISAVKLPEGLVPVIRSRDFTVATVAAPSAFLDAEAKPAAADAAATPAAAAPAAGGKAAAPAAGAKAAPAKAAPAKK